MAKRADKTTTQIQKLLTERRKIEQWLHRLDMAADETAAAVRDRVRGDYEARLTKVVEELQGYGDHLRKSLESHQGAHAELKTQEKAASEELAEAELRHAVGEFEEGEWRQRKAQILEVLVKVREGLAEEETEIADLEEVLSDLNAPPAEYDEAAAPESPDLTAADARLSLGSELGLRDLGGEKDDLAEAMKELETEKSAPEPEPEPEPEPSIRKSGSFNDELAFLKSVTEDQKHGPAAAKATGTRRAVPESPPPAEEASDVGAEEVERLEATQINKSRPSVMNQRTLKCGECGAMNLPTEWYCDRCGAELAAL